MDKYSPWWAVEFLFIAIFWYSYYLIQWYDLHVKKMYKKLSSLLDNPAVM